MIRPINQNDRKTYLDLSREFYHSKAVLHPVPERHFEDTFRQLTSGSPFAKGFLILEAGEAAGYCLLAVTWSQEAGGQVWWLEELYLRPEFQGMGLGSHVIQQLRDIRPPEVTRFRLEVEPDNQGARRLYEYLGFRDLGYRQMVLDFPPE